MVGTWTLNGPHKPLSSVPKQILRVRVGEQSGGGVGLGGNTAGGRREEVTGAEGDCSWALPPPSGWNLSSGYKAISETSAHTSPARFLHSCH